MRRSSSVSDTPRKANNTVISCGLGAAGDQPVAVSAVSDGLTLLSETMPRVPHKQLTECQNESH